MESEPNEQNKREKQITNSSSETLIADNEEDTKNMPSEDIVVPRDMDVLFGRGGRTNNHPGNRLFRRLIRFNRTEYIGTEDPAIKQRLIISIIASIQKRGGRFLQSNKNGQWIPVPPKLAHRKTGQCFRETRPLRSDGSASPESVEPLPISAGKNQGDSAPDMWNSSLQPKDVGGDATTAAWTPSNEQQPGRGQPLPQIQQSQTKSPVFHDFDNEKKISPILEESAAGAKYFGKDGAEKTYLPDFFTPAAVGTPLSEQGNPTRAKGFSATFASAMIDGTSGNNNVGVRRNTTHYGMIEPSRRVLGGGGTFGVRFTRGRREGGRDQMPPPAMREGAVLRGDDTISDNHLLGTVDAPARLEQQSAGEGRVGDRFCDIIPPTARRFDAASGFNVEEGPREQSNPLRNSMTTPNENSSSAQQQQQQQQDDPLQEYLPELEELMIRWD